MAQILYVEFGELSPDLIKSKLPSQLPKIFFQNNFINLESTAKNVMDIGIRMALNNSSLDKNEVGGFFLCQSGMCGGKVFAIGNVAVIVEVMVMMIIIDINIIIVNINIIIE